MNSCLISGDQRSCRSTIVNPAYTRHTDDINTAYTQHIHEMIESSNIYLQISRSGTYYGNNK